MIQPTNRNSLVLLIGIVGAVLSTAVAAYAQSIIYSDDDDKIQFALLVDKVWFKQAYTSQKSELMAEAKRRLADEKTALSHGQKGSIDTKSPDAASVVYGKSGANYTFNSRASRDRWIEDQRARIAAIDAMIKEDKLYELLTPVLDGVGRSGQAGRLTNLGFTVFQIVNETEFLAKARLRGERVARTIQFTGIATGNMQEGSIFRAPRDTVFLVVGNSQYTGGGGTVQTAWVLRALDNEEVAGLASTVAPPKQKVNVSNSPEGAIGKSLRDSSEDSQGQPRSPVAAKSPEPAPIVAKDGGPPSDPRTRFANTSYDTVIYFAKDGIWDEKSNKSGDVTFHYREVSRTNEYIEFLLVERNQDIRIFDKKMEIKKNGRWEWVANGSWIGFNENSAPAGSKPKRRPASR